MKINNHEINYTEEQLKYMHDKQASIFDLIDRDFEGYKKLSDGDKKALMHLVATIEIIDDVFLEQDHILNRVQYNALKKAAETSEYAADALWLFKTFLGVEGVNNLDPEPIEIFKGIKGHLGRNVYPVDMGVDEFHEIIKAMLSNGKVDEVRKILSSRTMVRRDGDELKAIDYVDYFADDFQKIADELAQAAKLTTNKDFAEYLELQAKALMTADNNLDAAADIKWATLQDTDLEFTLGRESYADGMTATIFENSEIMVLMDKYGIEPHIKDMLGIRVGIVNHQGNELILKFKEYMPKLAELMPYNDKYTQSVGEGKELKQTMVDVDLVALGGDYASCRGGITTAQNLPNDDKLSLKLGGGRRNAYHRQIRQQRPDMEKLKIIMDRMVDPNLHKYFDNEALHMFVIGHENAHSLGPDASFRNKLGAYTSIIEEHKADIASIAFMPEYVKIGVITEEQLKQIYFSWTVSYLFLRAKPVFSVPHRVADLMMHNFMLEAGAISFDENDKLHIDFGKMQEAAKASLAKTIEIQLSGAPEKAKQFIDKYTVWGENVQKIAQLQEELGVKPYIQINSHF